ncbi:hypothetical protein OKA05_18435 [Luteolibacter arcticus]|uniref:HEAT repeat domain-containing protein n=1 Tax=Luteolibacter arcticus TaxID=1581411 RepID=A0ABT3GM04_9BACT|nr:hypothetical protein [Luteolibacter arcticus]MCW1924550.1 hypothetical protein [Luteolibacter arcticus]
MPAYVIPAAVVVTVAWLLWRFLPVGKFHGQPVMLRHWWKFRRPMRIEAATRALRAAEKLPATQRLAALIQLEEKYGGDWLSGDSVRGAIIASGQDDALPWVSRILGAKRYRGVATDVIKACTSGDAQPHYRVQMFKMLLPLLDSRAADGIQLGIAAALLELDRDWAMRILTSPEYLTAEHPLFLDIFSAMNDAKVPLPPIEYAPVGQPRSYRDVAVRLQMARAAATVDPSEGERLLKLLIDSGAEVRARAGMELAALRGLPHPDSIGGRAYRGGVANLNDRERAVMIAYRASYAISNGNLMILVEHDELEGVSLAEIVEAFRETGAPARAAWVEAFMAILGPVAMERNPEVRKSRIKALGDDFRRQLSALQEGGLPVEAGEYEEDDLFLYIYMLEHEADFERE